MATDAQFKADLAKGKRSEARAVQFLEQLWGDQCFIENVSGSKQWQKEGVDYLLLSRKKKIYQRLEVKSGISHDNKFLIEMTDGEKLGWFYTSTADLLMWSKDGRFLIVDLPSFRLFLKNDDRAASYTKDFICRHDFPKTSECQWVDLVRIFNDFHPPFIKKISV